jgi:hypothetical protein
MFPEFVKETANANHFGHGSNRKSPLQRRGELCARRHYRSVNLRFGSIEKCRSLVQIRGEELSTDRSGNLALSTVISFSVAEERATQMQLVI